MRDARRFKMPEAAIAAIRSRINSAPWEDQSGLWPENIEAVDAFLKASTQWRVTALSLGLAPGRLVYIGLDYAGARAGMEAAGILLTPKLWHGVRIMEVAALEALNGIDG